MPAGASAPPGSDVALILWDMAQAEHLEESSALASRIQEELAEVTGSEGRGVKQAPFRVLVGAAMPAVLVEVAFISNSEEEKLLTSDAYQGDRGRRGPRHRALPARAHAEGRRAARGRPARPEILRPRPSVNWRPSRATVLIGLGLVALLADRRARRASLSACSRAPWPTTSRPRRKRAPRTKGGRGRRGADDQREAVLQDGRPARPGDGGAHGALSATWRAAPGRGRELFRGSQSGASWPRAPGTKRPRGVRDRARRGATWTSRRRRRGDGGLARRAARPSTRSSTPSTAQFSGDQARADPPRGPAAETLAGHVDL